MRQGLIFSAVVHVAAVLAAVLGVLPSPTALVMPAQPIPVDIVDIGEITNTRIDDAPPAPMPAPRPSTRPAPPPPAPPPPAATAPEPPPAATAPEPPPAATAPEPPPAATAPEPPPVPTPRTPEPPAQIAEAPRVPEPPAPPPPARQPEPAKAEPPEAAPPKVEPPKPKPEPPRPKPEPPRQEPPRQEPKKPEPPKPEPPKKEPEKPRFQDMLKDLTRQDREPQPEPETEVAQADPEPASAAPRLSDRLSVSEMDAVRRQVSACWNVDPGLPNVRDVVVEIRVRIGRDRVVESAEIVDSARMRSDRVYRAVAEGALRAVRNPRCNPLQLPPDRYDTWRDTVFVFSPRDIL
jgi:hypothetical protein